MGNGTNKLTWDEWIAEVNELLWLKLGMSYLDLDDFLWRDYYDINVPPEDAVEECMELNGYDFEED